MLAEVIAEAAHRYGDTPAYVTALGEEVSYSLLDRASDEAAAGMLARGVREGDVVALLVPSGPAYTFAYLAAAKIGAITAGVNERLSPVEKTACLATCAPRLVIADPRTSSGCSLGKAELLEVDASLPAELLLRELRVKDASVPLLPTDAERPVAIVFTSGTTGTPKAALFSNRQLDAISEIDGGKRFGGGGRTISATSYAHLGYMTKLPQVLRSGGTTYLMDRWDAGRALELIASRKITSLGGIPTQVAMMLRHETFARTDVSSVKAVVMGGGPATPALVREARERFGCPVLIRYSCTEAGTGVGTSLDDPPEDSEISVGRARGSVEVSIRDDDGSLLKEGETGEVYLKSLASMSGYYRDPDETARAFAADGAVRTGDLGYLDDKGRLHLVGRAKEMYVRGGYNVFPAEVEAVIASHPDVADIAIAKRPDPVMGEVGVAVVVARDPAHPPSLEGLRSYARGSLASYKLPEALLLVAELPRTPMEKLDRRALAALVAGDIP
jgi:acyl-CoA synthetase (AMP-forming)/AMP-acid ligase II